MEPVDEAEVPAVEAEPPLPVPAEAAGAWVEAGVWLTLDEVLGGVLLAGVLLADTLDGVLLADRLDRVPLDELPLEDKLDELPLAEDPVDADGALAGTDGEDGAGTEDAGVGAGAC